MAIPKNANEAHAASLKRLTAVHEAHAGAVVRLEELEAEAIEAERSFQEATAAHALGEKDTITAGAVQAARARVEEQTATVQGLQERHSAAAAEELRLRAAALEADVAASEKAGRKIQEQVEDLAAQLERAQQSLRDNETQGVALSARKADAERVASTRIRLLEGTVDYVEKALDDPTCIIDRVELRKAIARWRAGSPEFSNLHLTALGHNPTMRMGYPTTVAVVYVETGRVIDCFGFDFCDRNGAPVSIGMKRNACDMNQIMRQLDMTASPQAAVG